MAKATLIYKPQVFRLFSGGGSPALAYKEFPIARATAYRWYQDWVKEFNLNKNQGAA